MARKGFDDYNEVFEDLMKYKQIDTRNIKDKQSLLEELHKLPFGKKKISPHLVNQFVGDGWFSQPVKSYERIVERNTEEEITEEKPIEIKRPGREPERKEKIFRIQTPYLLNDQPTKNVYAKLDKRERVYYYYPKGARDTSGKNIAGRRVSRKNIQFG